jgi:hypothetical protein
MSIGGTALLSTIENHTSQSYRFHAAENTADRGDGVAILAPYASLTWTFDYMSISDYDWITQTLLSDSASAKFTTASLYNDNRTVINYTVNVTVRRPTHDGISAGLYRNVVWQIDYIM